MDILLFNPYYSQTKNYYSFYRPTAPLGLMYLAAYLKKAGVSSKIFELGVFDIKDAMVCERRVRFGLSDDAITDIVRKERPKIVGITCMYSIYYRDVVDIARVVKKADPSVQVVVGGNHASAYAEHLLKDAAIDYAVIGEGEETFLELSQYLLEAKKPLSVRGLAFRQDDRITKTERRPMIADLDQIPFPAYELLDYNRYLSHGNPFSMRTPGACLITSRGCPGACVYCTVRAVWGRTWRGRSPQNVIDEVALLKDRYGIREFAVLDDSASVDRKRWEGICRELMARNLDLKWITPNGIAHWTLTKDLLKLMRDAGCYRITFGIESGYPETRRFLGKPHSLDQAKELIQHANRIGLWTICTNIIGFPYEKEESIQATISFAKQSGTDFACFFLLMPQPTSDVYQYFKKEGLLDFDDFFKSETFDEDKFEEINLRLNETGCDTVYFTKEELSRKQKGAYRSFIFYRVLSYLFHPWRLLWKLRSLEDVVYVLRMVGKSLLIFIRTFNPLNKKSSDFIYVKSRRKLQV